jgi:L-ribulose-5-phosphate 3-epimerase
MSSPLRIGASSYGFLYHLSLADSFRAIADAGFELVEVAASPPHLDLSDVTAAERRQLRRALDSHGLKCVATNPVEMNPISPIVSIAENVIRHYRAAIELASDLDAPNVVMVSGRANPLSPMAAPRALDLLRSRLERLLPLAQRLGVTIALETVPYGFLQTSAEVAALVQEFDVPELRMTVDCANVFFIGSDPAEELASTAGVVNVVHISDAWRDRWAHTQVGRGEINFEAIAHVLREASYDGPTIYELVDGEDPGPRLRDDWAKLSEWGWSR